ncbi:MAG: hypothetical protein JOZ87_33960 [Chloroflexi bacterium]|nr:hypothetical protein [Chloroflexota bacterium]
MSVDFPGVGALVLVSAEWLALGWLSGVRFPPSAQGATAANWALRVLVGASLVALAQLGLALVGIGIGSVALVLLSAGLGAAALRVAGSSRAGDCEAKLVPVERRERVGWLLLALVLLAGIVRSVLVPEAGWDAYSHWGLRAQAFASAGTLVDAHSEHEYYPPLVPLLEAWLYLQRNLVSIDLAKTIWAVIGSAFGVCLAWHLRLSLRSAWLAPFLAAGVVLSTTALLEGFWTGQADLALTTFLTLATLAAWQWQRDHDPGWLLHVAVFAAAAALTKFEGLPRVGIVGVVVLVEGALAGRARVWLPSFALLGPAVLVALLWLAVEITRGIAPNGEHVGTLQPLAIGSVALALAAVFGGVRTGGGVLVVVLGWAACGRSLFEPALRVLTLVVIAQAAATLIAFLVSATSPVLEVNTSATRLVEQCLPLALFVAAVGLARTGHL